MTCYTYVNKYYDDGLFNESVDATYIIHLEDNGQLNHINNQLENYHPTNIVYILFNKGYKKCKKQDYIINSSYDLVDANLDIFKHAEKQNYNNILILEDDFIFNPDIKQPFHLHNINLFLIKHINIDFQYYIGCIPLLMIPYDKYNYINKGGATHCVIHSRKHRNNLLKIDQRTITDWDSHNNNYYNNRYNYYRPLCYQLFPDTENKKNWGVNERGLLYVMTVFMPVNKNILKLMKLDKQCEPGYSYFYVFSKTLYYVLMLIIIFTIIRIIIVLKNNNKKYK
jgi:hypothetical protein